MLLYSGLIAVHPTFITQPQLQLLPLFASVSSSDKKDRSRGPIFHLQAGDPNPQEQRKPWSSFIHRIVNKNWHRGKKKKKRRRNRRVRNQVKERLGSQSSSWETGTHSRRRRAGPPWTGGSRDGGWRTPPSPDGGVGSWGCSARELRPAFLSFRVFQPLQRQTSLWDNLPVLQSRGMLVIVNSDHSFFFF